MKCAVVTPIGPGHEYFALDAEESVHLAHSTAPGPFAEIFYIKVDDTRGELGRSAARNQGVRLAEQAGADWIFFLDADDVMCPYAFAHVAPHLRCDAVWGEIYELTHDEESATSRAGQLVPITRLDELLGNDPFITLQIGHFVKTAVALAVPFAEEMDAGEDFDYFLRVWSQFACIKVARPFFYNRRATYAGGPRAATDNDWRIAVERVVCAKCAAVEFHADFELRGQRFRFFVNNPFDLIHRNFLKGRFFEAGELAFVESWVGTGAAIVEVGAYVGNHAVYYARFMRPRSLLVLEPNPESIALLRRNLAANDVAGADLSRLGVGAGRAAASYDLLCERADNRGASRLVPSATGMVKSLPLDDMITGVVDFIKIDVEGMELDVLAGARRVVAESQPKIMIEVFREQIPLFEQWLSQNQYGVIRQFEYVYAVNFMIAPDQ